LYVSKSMPPLRANRIYVGEHGDDRLGGVHEGIEAEHRAVVTQLAQFLHREDRRAPAHQRLQICSTSKARPIRSSSSTVRGDGLGHRVAVVCSIGPFSVAFSDMPPEEGRDLALMWNEEMAGAQRKHPGRVWASAAVPITDTRIAIAVLDHAVNTREPAPV
jgi:hypothetical protein